MVLTLTRPSGVGHFRKDNSRVQINALAVSPDGQRFATGGADMKLKIWRITSVLEKKEEKDESALLCTADGQDHAVQSLAWSPNGVYIASGDDGHLVKLWTLKDGSSGNLLEDSGKNEENWKCVVTFRGHAMDVTSLSWSPDAEFIASASIDNKVRVWYADPKYKERDLGLIETDCRAVLDGHQGWVKSVAWDPVGRYLASASDDKSVIVWRCSDWKPEATIVEPFEKSTFTSTRRQVSWSPDGAFLCVSHAYDAPKHVAFVVERNKWTDVEGAIRLVGHTKPISVCAFSPKMYERDLFSSDKEQDSGPCGNSTSKAYSTVVAIACEKPTLTLWTPGRNRPVIVCKNIFKEQILDMSWAADGYLLLVCSQDGFIASLDCSDFKSHPDVGVAMENAKVKDLLEEFYGDETFRQSEPMVAETPLQHQLEHRLHHQHQAVNAAPRRIQLTPSEQQKETASSSSPARQVQRESRTADGRRRISPVTLLNSSSSSTSLSSTNPATTMSSSSTLSPERRADNNVNVLIPRKRTMSATSASSPVISRALKARIGSSINEDGESTQVFSMQQTGLKRDTRPSRFEANVFIPASQPPMREVLLEADLGKSFQWTVSIQDHDYRVLDVERRPLGGVGTSSRGHRKFESIVRLLRNSVECWKTLIPASVVTACGNNRFVAVATKSKELYLVGCTGGELLVPAIQLSTNVACLVAGPMESDILACVTTDGRIRVWDVAKMICVVPDTLVDPVFTLFDVNINSTSSAGQGRRIRLESGIRVGGMDMEFFKTSQEDGEASADGVRGSNHSEAAVGSFAALSVTAHGTPILLCRQFATKKTKVDRGRQGKETEGEDQGWEEDDFGARRAVFALVPSMRVWCRVASGEAFLGSDFFSTLNLDVDSITSKLGERSNKKDVTWETSANAGLLYALQDVVSSSKSSNEGETVPTESNAGVLAESLLLAGEDVAFKTERHRLMNKAHLESLVSAAALLRSPEEYRSWLTQYVRRLVDEGDKSRLQALCDSLLHGRGHAAANFDSTLAETVEKLLAASAPPSSKTSTLSHHAFSKQELLFNDVLPLMAKNRQLQKLVLEYSNKS